MGAPHDVVTRAESTISAYVRRYELAWQRLRSHDAICAELISRAESLSRATVRQYRAAYAHVWSEIGRQDLIDQIGDLSGGPRRGRTSSQRTRRLVRQDLKRLAIALREAGEEMVSLWWLLTHATGLRPVEWSQAKLEGKCLVVRNAKATNGRAIGSTRHLVLDDSMRVGIQAFLTWIQSDYHVHYRHARWVIYRISRELWPERMFHPTLYSARHMFASEAKVAFNSDEVAALMGHASPSTAVRYYARRRKGGRMKVRPDNSEVAMIRDRKSVRQKEFLYPVGKSDQKSSMKPK